MNRAYSLLAVKSVQEDERVITGLATTPTPDRVGDIVEPTGAEFNLPLPLLMQHDSRQPIGHVVKATVTKAGIEITAKFVKLDEPGKLKERLDEAWQLVKTGLVAGLSIGFKPLEESRLGETWNYRFIRWLWLELSAVTIPANGDCSIETIKSLDTQARAASGPRRLGVVRLTPPASGHPTSPNEKGSSMKISEKIRRFEEKRAANTARIAAIHEETDESLNEGQLDEIKTLEAEIATIDRDLPSLKRVEADMAKGAKPVTRTVDVDDDAPLRPTPGVTVKTPPKPEPGIRLARYVRCMGIAHKAKTDVVRVAQELYGDRDPVVVNMIKAAGTAIGALNSTTDSSLIGNEGGFADFVEFLRNKTIIGRFGTGGIPALRSVPFRVPLVSQSTAGTGYWVGEGDGKPVTKPSFGRTELAPLKVAAIAVATMELLRDSSPAAEALIRDDLAAAIIERQDSSFILPSAAAVSGVSPASITYAAEAIAAASFTDADDIRLDVRSVMEKFITAKNPLTSGVWVMSPSNALALAILKNSLGQAEFPGMTVNGGTFMGLPVIVSEHVSTNVVLVNAADVWLADEGGIQIDMSDQASLQMVAGDDDGSTQNAITPTATSVLSLWQTNSVGFRAERTMNWAMRRSTGVAYLTSVAWGGAVNPS